MGKSDAHIFCLLKGKKLVFWKRFLGLGVVPFGIFLGIRKALGMWKYYALSNVEGGDAPRSGAPR